jgi:type IV pilus assembly protein PilE
MRTTEKPLLPGAVWWSGKTVCVNQDGFTLIELMITVVVIGILAAIAYPNYAQYVIRTNRAEARSILLENAQILERNYTTANRYDAINADGTGGAVSVIAQSPKPVATAKYTIAYATTTVGGVAGQTFTVTATPTGVMTGDGCGNLTLDSAGVQGAGALGVATCWGR